MKFLPNSVRCILAFSSAVFLAGCGTSEPALLHGETMGTTWSIAISDPVTGTKLSALRKETEALFENVNQSMSNWIESSEISRINQSRSTDWQTVSPELAKVLVTALQVHRLSDGYFDITIAPVLRLWGFGPDSEATSVPPEEEIQAALVRTGSEKLQVRLQPPALRKSIVDLHLDLSAIAKGYAVDVVFDHLGASGLENYMVEAGGDLRVVGKNHKGEPWRIGLENPLAGERTVALAIALEKGGVASSGSYRNVVEMEGERYPHGMDPYTGRPIKHQVTMVTVVADDAMLADALATAFYILGREKGLAIADKENMAVAFFHVEGQEMHPLFSEAFRTFLIP